MGLWRFLEIEGIGITIWAPPYPKIGGGRIYSEFSRPRDPLLPLHHCICSGSKTRLVETNGKSLPRRYCPVSIFSLILIIIIYSLSIPNSDSLEYNFFTVTAFSVSDHYKSLLLNINFFEYFFASISYKRYTFKIYLIV